MYKYIFFLLIILYSCQSKSETELLRRETKDGDNSISVSSKKVEETSDIPLDNSSLEDSKDLNYYVYKVVDGDTFWMKDQNDLETKVRLIGIDTPEMRNTAKKKKGFFAKEAKEYLASLILNKYIKIEFDVQKRDQYGRLLAYVYSDSGLFINSELVRNGYAFILTVPPNVQFENEFYQLQIQARDNKLGMWK